MEETQNNTNLDENQAINENSQVNLNSPQNTHPQDKKIVKIDFREEVIALIFKLREKRISYGKMEKFCGCRLNKSQLFQIYKRTWWPIRGSKEQILAREQEILNILKEITGKVSNLQFIGALKVGR